ncbi:hypothetical protein GCM10023195_35810 [Actinoallomurus liliacearum]|uniref:Knr4/Smi1-like domain-containing protein n=1 Tax=Actinoallomurus liliacearum TaxID=1080073 RepID=A0ABP8TM62_9ACTN
MALHPDQSWNRITSWLRQHAPAALATVNAPATEAEIADVRAMMGMPVPDDLIAWWRLANGVSAFPGLAPVPLYTPLPIEEVLRTREMMLSVLGPEPSPRVTELRGEPAGTPYGIGLWLPEWLPIASDHCGYHLFVDLRHGPSHGCVMEYDKYEGVHDGPLWPGTASMPEQAADAIVNGGELRRSRPQATDEGMLEWVVG